MTSSIGDCPLALSYQLNIDRWIVEAYQAGAQDFWHLVSLLPGVFPIDVRLAVSRLVEVSKVPPHLAFELPMRRCQGQSSVEVSSLPTANPLTSDWRFTKDTAGRLLERLAAQTATAQTVALLGVPSVYQLAAQKGTPRNFILVDQNSSFAASGSCPLPMDSFRCLDVRRDAIDLPEVHVVLADPPWYEKETLAFLRASAEICADQGTVLLGAAPDGARPGVIEERGRIIAGAQALGLKLVREEYLALSYATPFFEHNALRAAGFTYVPPNWRRGDLLIFERTGLAAPEHVSSGTYDPVWDQADVHGATFWVRTKEVGALFTPRLVPLVPGEILPSISRRDELRKDADVWTAGNRAYRCEGSYILTIVLRAMTASEPPIEAVERDLDRPLSQTEVAELEECVAQLGSIVHKELQDMRSFGNGQ